MCKMKENNDNRRGLFDKRTRLGSSAIIFTIVGAIAYILAWSLSRWWVGAEWKNIVVEILSQAGNVLLVGAALGYITYAAQLLGYFKQDMIDIMYGDKFLEKRNDIQDIWSRVTKRLFNSKFKNISDDLLNLIKDNYLPQDNSIYYKGYTSAVDLLWDKSGFQDDIIVRTTNTFTLIAEKKDEIKIPWRTWTNASKNSRDPYSLQILEYSVNGADVTNDRVPKHNETKNGEHFYEEYIPLKGTERYDVHNIIEKKYSLNDDFIRAFRASYIMDGLTLDVTHPEDMEIQFISRGTINQFKIINQTATHLCARYEGLILPQQGYVIAIRRKSK